MEYSFYNFLAMPLDQMAKIYGCKTKALFPYEYFGIEPYNNLIGNLNIEDFKSSLSNKLPTQKEVDNFNKDNSHKTGNDLSIVYLQNDVEMLDYCNIDANNLYGYAMMQNLPYKDFK